MIINQYPPFLILPLWLTCYNRTMIKLIKRNEVLQQYPCMPWIVYDPQRDEEELHMPEGASHIIVSSPASTYTRSINKICKEITVVFRRLKLQTFLVMGAQETAWRFRQRRYTDSKVSSTMEFFTQSGIRPRFNGAVLLSLEDFPIWFKHVSYLVRVNALGPEVHFLDITQSLYFSPCKYGNVHLTIVDKLLVKPFQTEINRRELIPISPGDCVSRFNNNNGIPGRQTHP